MEAGGGGREAGSSKVLNCITSIACCSRLVHAPPHTHTHSPGVHIVLVCIIQLNNSSGMYAMTIDVSIDTV